MKSLIRQITLFLTASTLFITLAAHGADNGLAHGCPDTLRYADTGVEGMEELRRSFGP